MFQKAGAVYAQLPALSLEPDTGTDHNDYAGNIEIVQKKGGLILRLGPLHRMKPVCLSGGLQNFDGRLILAIIASKTSVSRSKPGTIVA
ncbi:hypothetical protein HNQ08_005029 [Deinococcus humi]|uniref:Uncharacterized protein n=1 Tax=Deinococcus humi TaxID=662880 RepID=A0A7W8JZW2_9DEIO|nr:hypothetical protein [Deinococcus humi]GGO38739.1 hypothetical protein GCM10008949_45780 [Deinococcus humi]